MTDDFQKAEHLTRGVSEVPTLHDVLTSFPARLTCYAVVCFLMAQAVFAGLVAYGAIFVGQENGPVELAQVGLAVFASTCLFFAASRQRRGRAGLITCAAMVGYAAARESDTVFESVFFDDAYKYLVGLPLFLIAVTALTIDRRRVVRDAMWLVRQPAVAFFAIGGIYLCTFCQILDRPGMWTLISSPEEALQTKAMVEEFAELVAYTILAFSGAEAIAMALNLDASVDGVTESETQSQDLATPFADGDDHTPQSERIAA